MIPNVKPSIIYPLKDKVAPQSIAAAGTAQTGWIDCSTGNWLKLVLLVGAGAGTAAVSLDQATTAAGAGSKVLATAAQVGITAQGTGTVEADYDLHNNLDINGGFAFVRATVTVAGGAGTLASPRGARRAAAVHGPDSREGEARLATPRLSFFSRRNLWRLAT
jgi:hypothetical protein